MKTVRELCVNVFFISNNIVTHVNNDFEAIKGANAVRAQMMMFWYLPSLNPLTQPGSGKTIGIPMSKTAIF